MELERLLIRFTCWLRRWRFDAIVVAQLLKRLVPTLFVANIREQHVKIVEGLKERVLVSRRLLRRLLVRLGRSGNLQHLLDQLLRIADLVRIDPVAFKHLSMLVQVVAVHLGELAGQLVLLLVDQVEVVAHEFVDVFELLVVSRAP